MAFDGNGNFVRLHNWTSDAANNIDINASEMDGEDSGFAAGLSLAVTRDGQGKMTADFLPNADNVLNLGTAIRRWATINGTPIANLPVTQAAIGAYFQPQTAAEAAAGVTPVNFFRAPGNVLRYATNTTPGTTDMRPAIQAAVNQAINADPSAAPVYLPGGQIYFISGSITATTAVPLLIFGDGRHSSVIYQHADADVFAITASNLGSGRLNVFRVGFVAIVGAAMTTGRAIAFIGYASGANPVGSVIIREVSFQGSAVADEFKNGIYLQSANQPIVDSVIWNGVNASTTSTAILVQSLTPYSIVCTLSNIQIYGANTGISAVSSSNPGIENFVGQNIEVVGTINGILVQNTLGLGTYVAPKVTLDNIHTNTSSFGILVSGYIQIDLTRLVMYRFGALNNSAFVQIIGCQQFKIDITAQISDSTDCPVVMLDGTSQTVSHGIIDGIYSGKTASGFPVVHAVAGSTLSNIIVRGVIRTGYTRWLPSLSALPYTPGGSLQLNASSILVTDTDNINPSITPTGTTPNLVLDLTYVQCGLATINLASGTISTILGNRPGQRITLGCTSAGVVLANNASQAMPGGANFTFTAGQTIDLYRQTVSWLAVGRQ